MKKILFVGAALFSLTQFCSAATCTTGTLASYLALGSTGCSIGGETLSNFMTLSGITGATAISTGSVTVTPTGGTANPTLSFATTQSATGGKLLESLFTYTIAGGSFVSSSMTLSGSSETVDGSVTDIENYCAGGMFGSSGVTGCTGTAGSILTLDGIQNSASANVGPASFLNVTDDFTLSASTGTATGGVFTNAFATVPEPASILFAGLGLALAAGAGIRKRKSFTK